MNQLLSALKEKENLTKTTNQALTYKSTMSKVYDLFAQGGAMHGASDSDCATLFAAAYKEDPSLALKCLFWLRDIRGGKLVA